MALWCVRKWIASRSKEPRSEYSPYHVFDLALAELAGLMPLTASS